MGARQMSLLGGGDPAIDAGFAGLRRIVLDADCWIDHAESWVAGHEALMDELARATRWKLLRPKDRSAGPRASRALLLGWGDLVMMGGVCQRTWEHSIPKVASAEPRIALMLRPKWFRRAAALYSSGSAPPQADQ